MTTNLEEIYSRYRKADFTERLNIYLQFPELRDEFFEIEQKEKQSFFFEPDKSPSMGLNRMHGWISRRFSFLG
jgi:hypothetical protein